MLSAPIERGLAATRTLGAQLEAQRDLAPILIRWAFGYHLVQYTWEEVLLLQAHLGCATWLGSMGVPWPKFFAYVAMGTEFWGGVLWILGLWVRPVAALMAANFTVALCLVHSHHLYAKRFEAVQMLAVSLFLIFAGAGRLSLDAWRRRSKGPASE
ncbi:MAG: DoxX family protein [Verrucomicrobia bacterium]|nr:DoxX family protein [Verrucomicrobiota bacterium]